MALFRGAERQFAQAVSELAYCNPFLPERIELERRALGREFVETKLAWNLQVDGEEVNVVRINTRAGELVERLRQRLSEDANADGPELELYDALVIWVLYYRYSFPLYEVIARALKEPTDKPLRVDIYSAFLRDAEHLLVFPPGPGAGAGAGAGAVPGAGALPGGGGLDLPTRRELPHIFACYFQICRAFIHTFHHIIGSSRAAVRLRAAVWQSIFTHDMRRFRRTLYARMGELTTLVVGPSGTGKELVARAVGLSRYIPFDAPSRTFSQDPAGSFQALNLSALSPTLIESELFGHRRGAFTGAIADRAGWLELCRPLGTVFLDEIGELDGAIQVKLLRVLQTRSFQRIGDTKERTFHGKVIAATNRDLAREMQAGRFREDFYYRLCSDVIAVPTLRQRLAEEPAELRQLVVFIAKRLVGEEEAPALALEVEAWVTEHLGPDYPWAGNVRELEQCVRNVLVRKSYQPAAMEAREGQGGASGLAAEMAEGTLSAEDLLQRYCELVYTRTGSYVQTAKQLGLDRRTVKDKIDALHAARK